MTKYSVKYQATKEVEAPDRGEAVARVRDEEGPTKLEIVSVIPEVQSGQYL